MRAHPPATELRERLRRRVAEAEHREEGPGGDGEVEEDADEDVAGRTGSARSSGGGRIRASRAPLAGRVAPGRVAWSSPLAAAESASPEESLARLVALIGGDPRRRGGGAGAGCGQVWRTTGR